MFLPGESHGRRSLAGCTVHGVATVGHNLATKPPNYALIILFFKKTNPAAKSILNGETQCFPPTTDSGRGSLFPSPLSSASSKSQLSCNKEWKNNGKKIKKTGREEVKLSLFTYDMIYTENSKESMEKKKDTRSNKWI